MKLPDSVDIIEVGPRDGFQNIKSFIETDTKIEIIRLLLNSGIRHIEVTSFVNPKAIPQMVDANEVVNFIKNYADENTELIALVPNYKGAVNAVASGIMSVSFVVSASESHNQSNVRKSIAESISEIEHIIQDFPHLNVRVDIATSFGCPFEGAVPEKNVLMVAAAALHAGANEIVLCDTIGVANPLQTERLVQTVKREFSEMKLALHMHDTRGMGMTNILVGIENGIRRIETSVGGLGGCPFAPGAAGNTATEDVLHMLEAMGVKTGVNNDYYSAAVDLVKEKIKNDLTSRMAFACKYSNIV